MPPLSFALPCLPLPRLARSQPILLALFPALHDSCARSSLFARTPWPCAPSLASFHCTLHNLLHLSHPLPRRVQHAILPPPPPPFTSRPTLPCARTARTHVAERCLL